MKLATLSLLALLTAAYGSDADQFTSVDEGTMEADTAASDDIAARIADAEAESRQDFGDMSLDQRAEVLAARDAFGDVKHTDEPGRPMSRDEMIAQARAEEAAGY